MKTLLIAVLIGLAGPTLAYGQTVVQQVKKDGKQIVTEVEQIQPPPPVKGQPEAGAPSATSLVLKANNWLCGREFTDEKGRRWKMTSGAPYDFRPTALSGWHLVTVDGKNCFFTTTGKLFTQIGG